MTESLDTAKCLVDACSDEERAALLDYLKARMPQHPLEKEWGVDAEVILSAIARSSDLTKRGVRGIIAEAVFERHVLPALRERGWMTEIFVDDRPYDFLLCSEWDKTRKARIQVKLQRMLKQRPMLASEASRRYPKDMYVVEVQKTRGGIDPETNEDTRPYRFGEFDILAVNLHPSTRDWKSFLFTMGAWLIPRNENPDLIEIFQPVPKAPNDVWTEKLETCLEWMAAGEQKRIFEMRADQLPRRTARQRRED